MIETNKQLEENKEHKNPKGWQKGKSGNPKGRPKGEDTEVAILKQAIYLAKIDHNNKHILRHFVDRAYESDSVLIALIKKLIPDLTHLDTEGNINVNITVKELVSKIEQRLGRGEVLEVSSN